MGSECWSLPTDGVPCPLGDRIVSSSCSPDPVDSGLKGQEPPGGMGPYALALSRVKLLELKISVVWGSLCVHFAGQI